VIWKSQSFGFPPFVTNRFTSQRLRQDLSRALFAMEKDPQGQAILRKLNLDGFTTAAPGLYHEVREVRTAVLKAYRQSQ
jgi:phosphonate transport system substrate-binding protein